MDVLDLTSQSFGAWHVLGRGVSARDAQFWVCRCRCGTIAAIHEAALLEGRAQSCGCLSGRAAGFCDLTGQRFGQWLVLGYAGHYPHQGACWQCQCRCGMTQRIPAYSLRSGGSRQCKCCARRKPLAQRWYGAFFVQGFASIDRHGQATYYCKCLCGVELVVVGAQLRSGNHRSCGCRGKRVILHQTFGGLSVVADAGVLRGCRRWQCVCLHCQGVCVVATSALHPSRLGCVRCTRQRQNCPLLYRANYADIHRWFFAGISVAEIARRCQSPRETVRNYIRRHLANPLDAVGAALQASGEELVMEG